jgi:hypothetical protein
LDGDGVSIKKRYKESNTLVKEIISVSHSAFLNIAVFFTTTKSCIPKWSIASEKIHVPFVVIFSVMHKLFTKVLASYTPNDWMKTFQGKHEKEV